MLCATRFSAQSWVTCSCHPLRNLLVVCHATENKVHRIVYTVPNQECAVHGLCSTLLQPELQQRCGRWQDQSGLKDTEKVTGAHLMSAQRPLMSSQCLAGASAPQPRSCTAISTQSSGHSRLAAKQVAAVAKKPLQVKESAENIGQQQ